MGIHIQWSIIHRVIRLLQFRLLNVMICILLFLLVYLFAIGSIIFEVHKQPTSTNSSYLVLAFQIFAVRVDLYSFDYNSIDFYSFDLYSFDLYSFDSNSFD